MDYFWVAFGGGLGATLRLFVSQQFIFPVGTMLVNVLGSFAMGYAFVYLNDRLVYPMGLFVMTGVIGGFTTFSAFSLDVLKLWEAGHTSLALCYVFGSVITSILALILAAQMAKIMVN
jgi:CrcB protein